MATKLKVKQQSLTGDIDIVTLCHTVHHDGLLEDWLSVFSFPVDSGSDGGPEAAGYDVFPARPGLAGRHPARQRQKEGGWQEEKGEEGSGDREWRGGEENRSGHAFARTHSHSFVFSLHLNVCHSIWSHSIVELFFCFLILYVSPLSHSVAEKALYNTYNCLFTSVPSRLKSCCLIRPRLYPVVWRWRCQREDRQTLFFTFVNRFLSSYNQNRTQEELLLRSVRRWVSQQRVKGQKIVTKSVTDLNWNWANVRGSE